MGITNQPLKVYEIRHDNSYPYEQAVSVLVARIDDPIDLGTDQEEERTKRAYLLHPHRYVDWALVEGFEQFDCPPEDICGRAGDIWIQIDYYVFGSAHRPDDVRIQRLRKKLKAKGLKAVAFPEDLRPSELRIGSHDDAFNSRRVEGGLLREPFHALYVSERGKYPIVNYGSIPEGIDFDWIAVEVSTYRTYDSLPTNRELLTTLERYSACFDGLIDDVEVAD